MIKFNNLNDELISKFDMINLMKRLLAYLFIVLGLGLTLNINANAAKTKKIDYLCISQNKDNKKEYVKHKDDEYLLQVFYKNK